MFMRVGNPLTFKSAFPGVRRRRGRRRDLLSLTFMLIQSDSEKSRVIQTNPDQKLFSTEQKCRFASRRKSKVPRLSDSIQTVPNCSEPFRTMKYSHTSRPKKTKPN